jgi:hypothetical protein
LASSIALKDEDSSRNQWSRCRFAVHRPGNPVASSRSHGMPCRGFVLGTNRVRLAVADDSNVQHNIDISAEVTRRFLSGLETGVYMPHSL